MKITKISLTNFRSFKKKQTIEIAPVTLLFGPNSVGKSSVLMALAYVQQILEKGHCDPQVLDALGDKTIGGFRSLVYGGDLNRTICIRLEFELGKTIYPSDDEDYPYLANIFNAEILDLQDFGGSVGIFAFELEIAWSVKMEWAFVRNYRVWVNDVFMGRIHCSDDLKDSRIVDLNLVHPLALSESEQDMPSDYFINGVPSGELEEPPLDENDDLYWSDPLKTQLENVFESHVPGSGGVNQNADEELPSDCLYRSRPIGVKCQWGAIPIYAEHIKTNLKYAELEPNQNHLMFLILRSFLSAAFLEPINLVRRFLKSYVAIGPMRVIPDFDYVPNPNPEQRGWADGRAAWDLLHQNPNSNDSIKKLLSQCSSWLGDVDKLNTGYTISNWSMFEKLEGEKLYTSDHYLAKKRHLLFLEKGSDLALSASQLGTGISQILPVLTAAHYESLEFVSVEQPELHIHPRLQVELGDLLTQVSKDKSFLIETHSEHLILRIQKRLRQTLDKELPKGINPVYSNDISIVYLESTPEGVHVRKILMDDDGEFQQCWPHGFFIERREEYK